MNHTTKTNAPKGNGLDAAHDQPAKTFNKYATYFIANSWLIVPPLAIPTVVILLMLWGAK